MKHHKIKYVSWICFTCFILEACIDFDLGNLGAGWSGGVRLGTMTFPLEKFPQLFLDSSSTTSDSTIEMWLHVEYDSTIVFDQCDIEYQKLSTAEVTYYNEFSLQDTIDFKHLPSTGYPFAVDIDSLKPNVDYLFYASVYYVDRFGVLMRRPSNNSLLVRISL